MNTNLTSTDSYYGFTNYETWLVNLWLTNDEVYYKRLRRIITSRSSTDRQVRALSDWMQLEHQELDITNLWSDIVGGALERVNWYEIIGANHE